MSAKVDSAALQDGYQIYHHTFFFAADGTWAVVQQGMNEAHGYARRYHWLSSAVSDFVCEPHAAICSDQTGPVLNMVAQESHRARHASAFLAREKPEAVVAELAKMETLALPARHHIELADLNPESIRRVLVKTYDHQPQDFEELLGIAGVGPKAIRALALISELVYNAPASIRDPVRYSFAHGGKDGHPYPVDRRTYDQSIDILHRALTRARLGQREKLDAFRRLGTLTAS